MYNVYTHLYLYTWPGLMYFLLPIMFIYYNSFTMETSNRHKRKKGGGKVETIANE